MAIVDLIIAFTILLIYSAALIKFDFGAIGEISDITNNAIALNNVQRQWEVMATSFSVVKYNMVVLELVLYWLSYSCLLQGKIPQRLYGSKPLSQCFC